MNSGDYTPIVQSGDLHPRPVLECYFMDHYALKVKLPAIGLHTWPRSIF